MVAGYLLNAAITFCYLFVKTPIHLFVVQVGLGIAWKPSVLRPGMHCIPRPCPMVWIHMLGGLSTGQSQIVTGLAFWIRWFNHSFYFI